METETDPDADADPSATAAECARAKRPGASSWPPFEAPNSLRNGKWMTLAGVVPRPWLSGFGAAGVPETFAVDDGSRVVGIGNWHPGTQPRPTAVVLHGLTGSAHSGYAVGTAAKLFAEGFHTVRLNARNCGGTEALARTIYHAALIDDPLEVLETLAARPNVGRLYLVGWSMGGNLALSLAARRRESLPARLAGLAAVSPPLDLAATSRACERDRFNRLLARRFLASLRQLLERRATDQPGRIDLSAFDPDMSMWEFDAAFTAPLAGFESAEAYYAAGSAAGRLAEVTLPGLVLHALDDPLIPPESFPTTELVGHPTLQSALTTHGGHVAFVGARRAFGPRGRDRDRRWAEGRVADFLVDLERRTARDPDAHRSKRLRAPRDGTGPGRNSGSDGPQTSRAR